MPFLPHRFVLSAATFLALSHVGPVAPAATGQKPPMSLAPENRNEFNRLLQEYRAAGGDLEKKQEICRKALAIDLRLCEAAREHSQDMARLKFFSHESPVPGKKAFGDRAKLVGTTANGENIIAGASRGKSANDGWFHSPGHHRNQMGNFSRVGVGRSGTYYTQMFGS